MASGTVRGGGGPPRGQAAPSRPNPNGAAPPGAPNRGMVPPRGNLGPSRAPGMARAAGLQPAPANARPQPSAGPVKPQPQAGFAPQPGAGAAKPQPHVGASQPGAGAAKPQPLTAAPNPVPAKPPEEKAKALFDYEGDPSKNILGFKTGDVIDILQKNESGWWTGQLNGTLGYFPSNFVQLIENSPPQQVPPGRYSVAETDAGKARSGSTIEMPTNRNVDQPAGSNASKRKSLGAALSRASIFGGKALSLSDRSLKQEAPANSSSELTAAAADDKKREKMEKKEQKKLEKEKKKQEKLQKKEEKKRQKAQTQAT
jgi:hypothetical protein